MLIIARFSLLVHSALVPRAKAKQSSPLADGQNSTLIFLFSIARSYLSAKENDRYHQIAHINSKSIS